VNGRNLALGIVGLAAVGELVVRRGSQTRLDTKDQKKNNIILEPSFVDEERSGPLTIRSQFFGDVGMSMARYGRARPVARKASAEFIMVIKTWTKDTTLSASYTTPVEQFYARHEIRDADSAVYLDVIRLNRGIARGTGKGQQIFDRVLFQAQGQGARVCLLVSKHFMGDPRGPYDFWVKNGFEPLCDGIDMVLPQHRKNVLERRDIVLMGRIL
jgi:hypothetical protein